MASAVTRIAGEIYQVMQKMQGQKWLGGWLGELGRGAEAQMWGDEEEVMSIWAKREQLMKRLAFTKCNHGICQVIKSDSNPPSGLNQNNVHCHPWFHISDVKFFSWLDIAPTPGKDWKNKVVNFCGSVEDSKNPKTTSAWGESLELIIKWVSYSCGSKHAVLCFLFFTTSPSCFLSVNSSLTIYVAPTWPPPWLPYLLFHVVGKFFSLSVGHCFEAECLTGRRKEAIMGNRGRNKALSFPTGRDYRAHGGRGGIRSLGFQLCQFEVRIREKHSENTQQVPKHFPQHQKNCTWQQLMAATAGSWAEEHAAHVFSAYDM